MPQSKGELVLREWVEFDPIYDRRGDIKHCPIAHAIAGSDANILWWTIAVKYETVKFSSRRTDTNRTFRMPKRAKRFLRTLDHGGRPKGFWFELWEGDIIGEVPMKHGPGKPSLGRYVPRGPMPRRTTRTVPVNA